METPAEYTTQDTRPDVRICLDCQHMYLDFDLYENFSTAGCELDHWYLEGSRLTIDAFRAAIKQAGKCPDKNPLDNAAKIDKE